MVPQTSRNMIDLWLLKVEAAGGNKTRDKGLFTSIYLSTERLSLQYLLQHRNVLLFFILRYVVTWLFCKPPREPIIYLLSPCWR
jgi:hypothetical protein